jgi:hypothetical protein
MSACDNGEEAGVLPRLLARSPDRGDTTMPRKMKAHEIYRCATAYTKIKSHQIIEALYTDFTSWEGLLDFEPVIRAPNGSRIPLIKDPTMLIGVAQFQDADVAIIATHTTMA